MAVDSVNMLSRRSKVQEKKAARRGVFFIILSLALLGAFFVFGLPLLGNFVGLVDNFKKSSTPVLSDDTTPPGPPQLSDTLKPYTTEEKLSVLVRGEAGSTVHVFFNDVQIKDVVVGENSTFPLDLTLEKGENRIKFKATDQAGNMNEFYDVYKIVYDPEPPTLEISKPQEGQSFFALDNNITVEGTTEKDSQVTINDRLTIVSLDGKFSQKIRATAGENTLTIISTDKAGNKTEKVIKVSYNP